MHEIGYLTTYYGMIVEHDVDKSNVHMNNPAIVLDLEVGSVLKMGDELTSDIKDWYDTAVNTYISNGMIDIVDSLQLITFDRYDGILDIDDICTLINYMRNTPGSEKMKALLSMNADDLKQEVERLQSIGF